MPIYNKQSDLQNMIKNPVFAKWIQIVCEISLQ